MYHRSVVIFVCFSLASVHCVSVSYPFITTKFKVGIEYDQSLPMYGGSDRYRHMNNYDPFFVTITAKSKNNYVITYLEVSATVDASGEVDFHIIRGSPGSKTMVFQLVSNHTDFLAYNYLAYGIREEDYKKMTNVITVPIGNNGIPTESNGFIFTLLLPCLYTMLLYQ